MLRPHTGAGQAVFRAGHDSPGHRQRRPGTNNNRFLSGWCHMGTGKFRATRKTDQIKDRKSIMKPLFATILLVLSSVITQNALAEEPSKSAQLLVGKWQDIKDRTLCFSRDGAFSVEPAGGQGRWKLVGNRLTITYKDNSTSTIILAYIRENEIAYERKGEIMPCSRISH